MSERLGEGVRLHAAAVRARGEGRAREAVADCERALQLLEAELADPSPDVANVLHTLGQIHEDLADDQAPETGCARGAQIMEAIAGTEEAIVRLRVQALAGLGGIHRVLGRLDQAEALLRDA